MESGKQIEILINHQVGKSFSLSEEPTKWFKDINDITKIELEIITGGYSILVTFSRSVSQLVCSQLKELIPSPYGVKKAVLLQKPVGTD